VFRRFMTIVAAAALAAALAAAAVGRTASTPALQGTVGPGYTISLKKAGKKVTKLKAGRYRFAISDKASIHSFVIEQQTGGKFEKTLTSVSFTGKKTVAVTLKKGKWKFYCKPHESIMFGFFTVT
jgi:plastocyanin